ncbi:MAG TPA: arylesterase [Vicinamibacteria bacterium]|nr:arylesterase [Vicinamibacteria bacterium]
MIITATAGAACSPARDAAPSPAPSPSVTVSVSPVILFVGTSLTAGLGLDPTQAYPARIEERVRAEGLPYRVVNAGVSGETSAAARRRLDWLLRQPVAVLVIETGANDGLRGQDPAATRAEIQAMIDRARLVSPPPRILLVGMQAPPNMGREYTHAFRALYADLARANGVALVPFLLEGVAGQPRLNQSDGIHPTAEGQRILADNVWPHLQPLLAGP